MEWYYVCWPWLTAKRVEPVISISWASCSARLCGFSIPRPAFYIIAYRPPQSGHLTRHREWIIHVPSGRYRAIILSYTYVACFHCSPSSYMYIWYIGDNRLLVCLASDRSAYSILTSNYRPYYLVIYLLTLYVFRLDALALSVIATATWLAGWVAGCHTPVLYQNR